MSEGAVTLGILAGGRASRLGGRDKAWLTRAGQPQVLRWIARFRDEVDAVLVSANRAPERYAHAGLHAVSDTFADAGPLGGLHALASAARTPWLLTVPVDLVGVNDCLLPSLRAAGAPGACAQDSDGLQPLVALWPVTALLRESSAALARGEHSVQALQRALGLHVVRFEHVRYGNLNTPADLAAAGVENADE